MFRVEKNHINTGFTLTFENLWTISVQWGALNMCSVKGDDSPTAEIAIWPPDGSWYKFEDGQDVLGYQTPDQVAEWIQFCKTQKPWTN
jgi:hypothetical protein